MDLMRERGQARPLFETVFDLVDDDPVDVQDETVMRVSIVERDGLEWRLRYSTDAIDEECAARIAGYHCAALALMAGDLDADHHRQTLVSPEEVVLQVDGFAGRQRQLPDRRVHELFEERVRAHPAAIAAIHGEAGWTYRQAQWSRQSTGARAAEARVAARRSGRCGDGAYARLDGVRAGHLQGGRRVSACRAASARGTCHENALPGGLPRHPHGGRQHDDAEGDARFAAEGAGARHRGHRRHA